MYLTIIFDSCGSHGSSHCKTHPDGSFKWCKPVSMTRTPMIRNRPSSNTAVASLRGSPVAGSMDESWKTEEASMDTLKRSIRLEAIASRLEALRSTPSPILGPLQPSNHPWLRQVCLHLRPVLRHEVRTPGVRRRTARVSRERRTEGVVRERNVLRLMDALGVKDYKKNGL